MNGRSVVGGADCAATMLQLTQQAAGLAPFVMDACTGRPLPPPAHELNRLAMTPAAAVHNGKAPTKHKHHPPSTPAHHAPV